MQHHFDTENAKKYGLIPSIIIENLRFWVQKNLANRKHIYEERVWTYNSVSAFAQLFPYLTPKQIRTALETLEVREVVLKGQHSKNKTDRTSYYAFVEQENFLDFSMVEDDFKCLLLPFSLKNAHLPAVANQFADIDNSICPLWQTHLPAVADPFALQGKSNYADRKQIENKYYFQSFLSFQPDENEALTDYVNTNFILVENNFLDKVAVSAKYFDRFLQTKQLEYIGYRRNYLNGTDEQMTRAMQNACFQFVKKNHATCYNGFTHLNNAFKKFLSEYVNAGKKEEQVTSLKSPFQKNG